MDLGSRQEVKAAEAAAAARRRASWISKQVAGFWKKAQQVVNYKVCGVSLCVRLRGLECSGSGFRLLEGCSMY
jgi:hypothetical protein